MNSFNAQYTAPVADVLRHIYDGAPCIVVDSPPGAGKSTTIASVVQALHKHDDFTIRVGVPTHRAAAELATKIAGGMPQHTVWLRTTYLPAFARSAGVVAESEVSANRELYNVDNPVVVSTIASLKVKSDPGDILIIDEAYQATYADLYQASDSFEQVILVGDPGQIGPVTTQNTRSLYRESPDAPDRRGPEVFRRFPESRLVTLPCTYRVGSETVEIIAPLYDFPFHSERIERYVSGLPEVSALMLPAESTASHVGQYAVALVEDFLGRTVEQVERNGAETSRPMTALDIAVVVARNKEQLAINTALTAAGYRGVTVDTADRLQGGQWHAVIAVDPLLVSARASKSSAQTGRLCVMTSRHMCHLTWLYSSGWGSKLEAFRDTAPDDVRKGIAVRSLLTQRTAERTVRVSPAAPLVEVLA